MRIPTFFVFLSLLVGLFSQSNLSQSAEENKALKSKVRLEEGKVYIRTEEYEKAVQFLTESIELDPNNAEAYHFRGSAYYFLGKTKSSCEDWKRACELDTSCRGWNFGYYQKVCTH